MNYLNSKELNEIKFGSFVLRRFFMELAQLDSKLNKENKQLDFKIDLFIENNIIESIGKVLTIESNIEIISELTWALVNFTYFPSEKYGSEYIKKFINDTYKEIFKKLVKMDDNEILINLYLFFINCISESDEFAKFIFFDENFIKLCITKYLEQNRPAKLFENEAKKDTILFFVSLSKLSNILNEKQKTSFYIIYEKFLGVMFDSDIIIHVIFGIRNLILSDSPKEKIIFNIIKKNNYDLFNKLFISFNDMYKKEENFQIDLAVFNIVKIVMQFISLSEEEDILFLVRNTHLMNFLGFFIEKIYYKSSKYLLLDVLVNLSHHTANVVLNMIQDRDDFLQTIKKNMNDTDFTCRIKCIEIVYLMFSLISLDINLILFKNEIIEHLVKISLIFEEEKTCLKYILSSILYFINSIKPLENKWKIEIINNLIKIGLLNGFENKTERFEDEHILIINQINSEIKNILGDEDNISQEKDGINGGNINILSSHNPFMIFNKTYDAKNISKGENNNENIF